MFIPFYSYWAFLEHGLGESAHGAFLLLAAQRRDLQCCGHKQTAASAVGEQRLLGHAPRAGAKTASRPTWAEGGHGGEFQIAAVTFPGGWWVSRIDRTAPTCRQSKARRRLS